MSLWGISMLLLWPTPTDDNCCVYMCSELIYTMASVELISTHYWNLTIDNHTSRQRMCRSLPFTSLPPVAELAQKSSTSPRFLEDMAGNNVRKDKKKLLKMFLIIRCTNAFYSTKVCTDQKIVLTNTGDDCIDESWQKYFFGITRIGELNPEKVIGRSTDFKG